MTNKLFFELIKNRAVGKLSPLSYSPTAEDWEKAFCLAKEHALAGVLFSVVEHLPISQYPPREILMEWFVSAEKIKQMNSNVNADAVKICDVVRSDGLRCLILKGQGVGAYYPIPELRTPGDIDLWIEGGAKVVLKYLRSKGHVKDIVYTHSESTSPVVTPVEFHHNISFFYNPLFHYRLKKYVVQQELLFDHSVKLVGGECIYAPTVEFNRFYILLHIYRHVLAEGIGLRQLMDYYYVLCQGGAEDSIQRTRNLLKSTGMQYFTSGVMWIMKTVFALDNEYLLFPPNEKLGKKLLKEIMCAGNFGKYDKRINWNLRRFLLPRVWGSIKRKIRFFNDFPLEICFDIPARLVMFLWKLVV